MNDVLPPPSVDECLNLCRLYAQQAIDMRAQAMAARRHADAVPRIHLAGEDGPDREMMLDVSNEMAIAAQGAAMNLIESAKSLDTAIRGKQ